MQHDPIRNPTDPETAAGIAHWSGKAHAFRAAGGIAAPDHPPRQERDTHGPGLVVGRVPRDTLMDQRSAEHRVPWFNGAKLPRYHGAGVATEPSVLDDVLSNHQFLLQLRREQRRSDRSKSPLSLALIRFDDGGDIDATEDRLHLIQDSKRETDLLGYLDHDLFAVLLPDTNAEGTQRFVQKLGHRANGRAFTSTAATYPDQLFDSLATTDPAHTRQPSVFVEAGSEVKAVDLAKRGIDVIGASVAIALFSPLMLVTAVLVAVTSPGPVVYKQTRLGRRGVPFDFYKFRSMHRNADSTIHREHVTTIIKGTQEPARSASAGTAWRKLEADPRITSIGRLIRKTSIDELPQLFSVLKGDMSLVGPRPPLRYEAEAYQPWHLRRILEVKPGITGLWQVNGRGRVSFDDMVRMDLKYIRERSLRLDLKILLKTAVVVLRRDGAT